MEYISTRGESRASGSIQAMLEGLASDGGLFIPRDFPERGLERILNLTDFSSSTPLSYADLAGRVLSLFLTDFTATEINCLVKEAYYPHGREQKFTSPQVVPLKTVDEGLGFLELWHGPTCAFKDLALQLLPHLLVQAARKTGDDREIILLVATSGDTGKAALEGFKDLSGTRVIVFYPSLGVSEVQKRQMLTQEGKNTTVIGVHGNFDHAQTGVKAIFSDRELRNKVAEAGMGFSSANSINWGRLAPQVVYYVWAYLSWIREGRLKVGESFNIVVPTGNFGNILAAYYGKKLGLPINKLICASNTNKVLTDFFRTGVYNRKREFHQTISPSMDILISSNLERLLFEIVDRDSERIKTLMNELKENGEYELSSAHVRKLGENFWGGFATEEDTKMTITEVFNKYKYLLDPHTAVGYKVYGDYTEETGDRTPTVIASTASPFKFPSSVSEAVMKSKEVARPGEEELQLLQDLSDFTGTKIPAPLENLIIKPIRHNEIVATSEMKKAVQKILFPGTVL